jgi:hypothetical protein
VSCKSCGLCSAVVTKSAVNVTCRLERRWSRTELEGQWFPLERGEPAPAVAKFMSKVWSVFPSLPLEFGEDDNCIGNSEVE